MKKFAIVLVLSAGIIARPVYAQGIPATSVERKPWTCCTDRLSVEARRDLADRGDAVAEFELGDSYYRGAAEGQVNWLAARRWLQKSAEQGNENAQDELSELYARAPKDGREVRQDWVESYFWLLLAMKIRDPRLDEIIGPRPGATHATLAALNAQNAEDADYGRKREIEGYLTAAQVAETRKRADAWKPAGGNSVPPPRRSKPEKPQERSNDKTEYCCLHPSVSELRISAEGGDAQSQEDLGSVYYYGRLGTDVDWNEAAKWLHLAGDQGNEQAQDQLSRLYAEAKIEGPGVHQDWAEAYFWFLLTAQSRDARLSPLVGVATERAATTPDELEAQTYRAEDAKRARQLEAHLTASQIAETKKRVSQWKAMKHRPATP